MLVAFRLATKYWLENQDFCKNVFFAKLGGVTLCELNKFEAKLFDRLDYKLHIPTSVMAEKVDCLMARTRDRAMRFGASSFQGGSRPVPPAPLLQRPSHIGALRPRLSVSSEVQSSNMSDSPITVLMPSATTALTVPVVATPFSLSPLVEEQRLWRSASSGSLPACVC